MVNEQNDLMERGHIYKGKHEGWYAISDECFYPANQVQDVETSEGVKKVRFNVSLTFLSHV